MADGDLRADSVQLVSEPLISTPLLMHWISLLRGEELERVENVTDLYRELVAHHWKRECDQGQERIEPLDWESWVVGLTRVSLAILARSPETRLPLATLPGLLEFPEGGDPARRGAVPWWPGDPLFQQSAYCRQALVQPGMREALLRTGLFRMQGRELGLIHDSLIYYFAGGVALREYV